MPEHAYIEEVPSNHTLRAEPPSAAESECDAGSCHGGQLVRDSELEQRLQYIVGDCTPDGRGGCQGSSSGSPASCCSPTCLEPAQEFCYQSNSDVLELSCQGGCYLRSGLPCTFNSSSKESHKGSHSSNVDDDCCVDCDPNSFPAPGQGCPIAIEMTSDNEDNVFASTVTTREPDESYRKGHYNIDGVMSPRICTKDTACSNHPSRRLEAKKQDKLTTWSLDDFCIISKKSMATEDTAEKGGGRIRTLLLDIHGMDCPSCAQKLTRAFLTLPSVQNVKVNSFTGQASLTYREGLIFPPNIASRATKLTGFDCVVVDEARPEGRHRILRIKCQMKAGVSCEYPVLPPGVVILKAFHTESGVVFEAQYDAAVIQPRSVLDIFVSLGGSFLPPPKSNASDQVARNITSLFRRTLISAILCIPVIVFSWAPLPPHPIIYGAASLFLATCIQFYVGAPLYSAAFRTLYMQHILDMDVLVAVSSTIAYVFSLVAYAMQAAGHEFSSPFFETPTLLLTFITLGNLISAYACRRATSVLDGLRTLQPDLVQILSADGAAVAVTHMDLVQPRDVLRVASNTLIPTDGIVLRGSTQVDESALTGESLPVDKLPGAPLTAGTRNMTYSIDMEVTRPPAENTLAELAGFVARLQEARLPIQDLADHAAAWFAPVTLAVAVVVFITWIAVGSRVRGEDLAKASLAALRYTIAVLIVSCPCAIVLCVPMVIVITGAVGIGEGVLFNTATAVQHAKNTTVVVFDKTGTLTLGKMGVTEAHIMREDAVGTILALVSQDSHPVAHAVAKYLRSNYPHVSAVPLSEPVQSLIGKGLETTIDGVRVCGGSPSWLGLQIEPLYSLMTQKALTMFAVTIDKEVVAFFGLTDKPRPTASAAVEILQRQGIQVHIVSGDAQPVVWAFAKQLGIPQKRALGGCLPAEKVTHVRELQAAGARVMFIGDGTNDTPALAAADISVAMGSGTDVARSAANVVFLAPDLARALAALLRLSRGAVRRVYLNFVWSAIYNLSAVLLAAGAFVKIRIAPEYAALGEVISVVPVVLIAWSMWFLKY